MKALGQIGRNSLESCRHSVRVMTNTEWTATYGHSPEARNGLIKVDCLKQSVTSKPYEKTTDLGHNASVAALSCAGSDQIGRKAKTKIDDRNISNQIKTSAWSIAELISWPTLAFVPGVRLGAFSKRKRSDWRDVVIHHCSLPTIKIDGFEKPVSSHRSVIPVPFDWENLGPIAQSVRLSSRFVSLAHPSDTMPMLVHVHPV